MTFPSTGLIIAVAGGLAIIALRLGVRRRRGNLVLGREWPTLVGFGLILLSLILVDAAGSAARTLLPPLVILATGLGLAVRDWGRFGPIRLQVLGYAAIFGGGLLLLVNLATLIARQE
jgi:hypothetical protein